ncbi:MAG: sensor histidine kinase, partial [Syntrophothermus sp.]
RVFADPDMVHSIIQNLLTNAVKFSREGSMINLYSFDSDDGLAGIAVKDNGIGMKGDDLENIFRIDVRVSRTGTNDEKGTGLGLIICREMVEKHGGRIWAESRPGEGSTFMFTLPRVCSN